MSKREIDQVNRRMRRRQRRDRRRLWSLLVPRLEWRAFR